MGLLSRAGNVLHSFQPHLSSSLPNSTDDGSWFISPERHVAEFLLLNCIYGSVLCYLAFTRKGAASRGKSAVLHAGYRLTYADWTMAALLAFSVTAVGLYKAFGADPRRIWFMLMPCHYFSMIQVWCLLTVSPLSTMVFNIYLYTLWPQVIAILTPDTTGYSRGFETMLYWVQHILLVVLPVYCLVRERFVIYPYGLRMHAAAMAIACLVQHNIVCPAAIYSGLNLNFMLNPPKLKVLLSLGTNYRLVVNFATFFLQAISRFGFVAAASLIVRLREAFEARVGNAGARGKTD